MTLAPELVHTAAQATAGASGCLSNTATVASTTSDPSSANNSDTATTTVSASADLSIAKSDAPDPVNAGAALTYTLAVTNLGPDNAASVMVTDGLPAGLSFVSATATQGTCTNSGGAVSCALGSLASNAFAAITIQATTTGAGLWTNFATAACSTLAWNSGNPSPVRFPSFVV